MIMVFSYHKYNAVNVNNMARNDFQFCLPKNQIKPLIYFKEN